MFTCMRVLCGNHDGKGQGRRSRPRGGQHHHRIFIIGVRFHLPQNRQSKLETLKFRSITRKLGRMSCNGTTRTDRAGREQWPPAHQKRRHWASPTRTTSAAHSGVSARRLGAHVWLVAPLRIGDDTPCCESRSDVRSGPLGLESRVPQYISDVVALHVACFVFIGASPKIEIA
jgi:hypothetical protein